MVKIDNFYIEKNTLNFFCLKILLKKKKKTNVCFKNNYQTNFLNFVFEKYVFQNNLPNVFFILKTKKKIVFYFFPRKQENENRKRKQLPNMV